jgi:HEAT repeat protein
MRREWRRLAGLTVWVACVALGCADLRELTSSPEELQRQHEERAATQRQGQVEQARATLGRSPDPRERAAAARKLGELKAAAALPELTAALRDADGRVRAAAADALGKLGEPAREAVPALRAAIAKEEDGQAIVEMAWTLIGFKTEVRELVGPLRKALRHPEPEVRFSAALALDGDVPDAEVFPAFLETVGTPLGKAQRSETDPVRRLVRIVKRQYDRRFVPALLDALERGTPGQRAGASRVLAEYFEGYRLAQARGGRAEPPPATILPAIGRRLQDSESEVRAAAAYAIRDVGIAGKSAGPALVPVLRDPEERVRVAAANALGSIGSDYVATPGAVAALADALRDPSPEVRQSAAQALSQIGPGAKAAAAALTAAATDPSADVRRTATTALGSVNRAAGPPASPSPGGSSGASPAAIGVLVDRLGDADARTRDRAIRALGEIGPGAREAGPKLVPLLRDGDASVRISTAEALGSIGKGGAPVPGSVPALAAALGDPDARVRWSATNALGELGPAASAAGPALVAALRDADPKVRLGAAYALGEARATPPGAVPGLVGGLTASDPDTRGTMARALGQLRPPSKEAVPPLVETLRRDGNEHVRLAACTALRDLAPVARDALPALRAALGDASRYVRDCAQYAIPAIEGGR